MFGDVFWMSPESHGCLSWPPGGDKFAKTEKVAGLLHILLPVGRRGTEGCQGWGCGLATFDLVMSLQVGASGGGESKIANRLYVTLAIFDRDSNIEATDASPMVSLT